MREIEADHTQRSMETETDRKGKIVAVIAASCSKLMHLSQRFARTVDGYYLSRGNETERYDHEVESEI